MEIPSATDCWQRLRVVCDCMTPSLLMHINTYVVAAIHMYAYIHAQLHSSVKSVTSAVCHESGRIGGVCCYSVLESTSVTLFMRKLSLLGSEEAETVLHMLPS